MRAIGVITSALALYLAIPSLGAAASVQFVSEIRPSAAGQKDNFGASLSASDAWLAVGAPLWDAGGTVHLFRRLGKSGWAETQAISESGTGGRGYGVNVALAGQTLAVGASLAPVGQTLEAGVVHIYQYSPLQSQWLHVQKLEAPDVVRTAQFGVRLAMEGNTLAVGATGVGSVYIFEKEKEEWQLRQRLAIRPGQPWDLFGSALSLKKDHLLVGAPRAEAPQWENGAAYLYKKTALRGGTWSLVKTLSSPHTLDLGAAVALSDGNIVVGENYENSVGYVRSFSGGLSSWSEVQRLDSPDSPPWIQFGQVLLLSKGWLLASNSRFASGQVGYQPVPGMVHAFLPQGNGQWVPFDTLAPPQPAGGDAFGYALAANERSIFVGAPALYRSSPGVVFEYQIGP